jgi:hypothetical protein
MAKKKDTAAETVLETCPVCGSAVGSEETCSQCGAGLDYYRQPPPEADGKASE